MASEGFDPGAYKETTRDAEALGSLQAARGCGR